MQETVRLISNLMHLKTDKEAARCLIQIKGIIALKRVEYLA